MILAMFAAAIFLQPAEETPPPEVAQAGEAWSECLGNAVDAAPANVSPRDAARAVLATCNPLQTRMVEAHGRWVDSAIVSDAERRDARDAMRRSLASMETQLIQAIRASRTD